MEFLFNYNGQHIACVLNEQLYSVNGVHIGRYIPSAKIYVDLKGNYLGQVPFTRRLLHSDIYSYDGVNFGDFAIFDSIGNIGNIGEIGAMDKVEGYSDISLNK